MKEKLKKIIESNFKNSNLGYELKLNDELLIIKNIDGDESDFFYFIFDNSENLEKLNSELLHKKLIEEDSNQEVSELEQYEKNLNFIYFIKVPDKEYKNLPEKLKEKAYQIEEDKFYAKEKVIFYTEKLEENFTNYSLDISGIEEVNENMNDEIKFLLDLVIGLTFIKIDFTKSIGKTIENNIFFKSFNDINKNLIIKIKDKNLETKIFTDNEKDFREKVVTVNLNNSGYYKVENNELTDFEEDLLSLFGEGKTELESEILAFKYIENEDK